MKVYNERAFRPDLDRTVDVMGKTDDGSSIMITNSQVEGKKNFVQFNTFSKTFSVTVECKMVFPLTARDFCRNGKSTENDDV